MILQEMAVWQLPLCIYMPVVYAAANYFNK